MESEEMTGSTLRVVAEDSGSGDVAGGRGSDDSEWNPEAQGERSDVEVVLMSQVVSQMRTMQGSLDRTFPLSLLQSNRQWLQPAPYMYFNFATCT